MEQKIILDFTDVTTQVKKHLAIIGKRLEDSKGDTQFAKITLSSAETGILEQYVNAAAETFVAELSPLVTFYKADSYIQFVISNSRWASSNNGINTPFCGNFMGYVVAYCANALFGMYAADYAQKYTQDMQRHITAAYKLVYVKQPPTADTSHDKDDFKGAMLLDDGTTEFDGTNA